ncbi:hypothetical protein Ddc_12823 [Ditylenchus destructor]|nr:hypothetical protein Ddc_12823 [Ditylenchus destructor]
MPEIQKTLGKFSTLILKDTEKSISEANKVIVLKNIFSPGQYCKTRKLYGLNKINQNELVFVLMLTNRSNDTADNEKEEKGNETYLALNEINNRDKAGEQHQQPCEMGFELSADTALEQAKSVA